MRYLRPAHNLSSHSAVFLVIKSFGVKVFLYGYHFLRYFLNMKIKVYSYKESLPVVFFGASDGPEYDIIWTENGNVINRFTPKILTFK